MERITVEEFISRIIRHIPDENFKTMRYYGVYSRRIKSLCKKIVTAWQKEARKWIVKAKRMLKRRNWRERIKEGTGKDPLVCPRCECYYEFKGEVCLQDGVLGIKYASCFTARRYLERMIPDLTGIQEEKTWKKEEKSNPKPKEKHSQLCLFAV